jgi:hypothetical protein
LSVLLTEWLPAAAGWSSANLDSVLGIVFITYRSLVNSTLIAFWIVFQTLYYFRLRREKHDLTFFDLSATKTIEPAAKLVVGAAG